MRCLAAKHAELNEETMSEDAAAAASKRRRCMQYGFWRRCFTRHYWAHIIGDGWGEEAASAVCDDRVTVFCNTDFQYC